MKQTEQMLDVQLSATCNYSVNVHAPRCRQSSSCCSAAVPEPSSFMFVTTAAGKTTFQPLCSGNRFGEMKYSFHDCSPADFMWCLRPVQSREPARLEMTASSQPLMGDGGWRSRGLMRIRAADHQNQALFLFWTGHCIIGGPGLPWSVISATARTINQES